MQRRNQRRRRPRERKREVKQKEMKLAPVAKTKVIRSSKPMVRTLPAGDAKIRHREYIFDVVAPSTGDFGVTSISINPGLALAFPWLSSVARNYESYKFNFLKFVFETTSPTSAPGTVILTVDYDAADAAPGSKMEALSYENAVRTAPWNSVVHSSSDQALSKRKSYFVRPGAQPSGTDIRLYDTGNLYVIVTGSPPSQSLGELYVEYDVTLSTPQLISSDDQKYVGAKFSGTGVVSDTAPLGTSVIEVPGSYGITYDLKTNLFTFAVPGTYQFAYTTGPNSGLSGAMGISNTVGAVAIERLALNLQSTGTSDIWLVVATVAGVAIQYTLGSLISVTAPKALFSLLPP